MNSLPTHGSALDQAADAALASGPRPPQPNAFSAATTFAWRVLLKTRHVPEELGDAIGIPVLFTLLFTYLFGGALKGSTGDYLQFLLPGTLVLAVVFVTVYSGVNLNADLSTGAFDRLRSLPVWRPAPIVGSLIGDAGRYLLAATIVIALGLIMGYVPAGGVVGVLAAVGLVLLFALGFSWVWLALGLVVRSPRAVMSIGFTLLFPLTFMSNIFVETKTMPSWLEAFAQANPISHLVTAERSLMDGTATAGEVLWVLAATAVLTAAFASLTIHLYRRIR